MDEAAQKFLTLIQEGEVNKAGEFLAAHSGQDPEVVCGELQLIIKKWRAQLQKVEHSIESALLRNDYEGAAALFVVATDYKLDHLSVVEHLRRTL